MGLLRSTVQRLAVAVALIPALSFAGLSSSHAASPRGSETDYGLPCNDLCAAYMAWSDRVMGKPRPSQPRTRVVAPRKKPERTVHRASATRQSGLNLFAQLPRRSDAVPRSIAAPHVQVAPPEPVEPVTERPFAADGIVTASPADAGDATNMSPATTLVSVAGLVSAAQDSGTLGRFARGLDGRSAVSLGLALCIVLSLLAWGWFRRRAQAADTFR
jgi:hypothetical protein